ncbi:MAG: ABC transporter substrate-binding protein [Lachnospirales bacterium]
MKKFISLTLATALVLTATACSSSTTETTDTSSTTGAEGESTESGETTEGEAVELNTVSMFGGTDPTGEYYQAVITSYQEKYPNVTVNDISSTSDETWKTSVVADFQVGNEPDVLFYFTGVDAEPLIESGKLVDVATIQAEYPDYGKDISASPLEFMVEPDGNTYALPVRGFWEGLFVNKDLFDQYGLELPTDWEKMETAVTTFAENGIVPIAVSFADVPHYWIEHMILSYGGVDEHSKTLTPGEAAPSSWAEGLQVLNDLYEMNAFSPDATATSDAATGQLFKDKKAAMMVDGSWFAGGITDQDNTVAIAFPQYSADGKDPSDIIGGFSSGFYITKKAWDDPAKREAAVNFVMEMTSTETIAEFAKVGGAPAAEIEVPSDLSPLQASGLEFSSAAKTVSMPIDSRLSKQAWEYIVSNVSNIVDGSMSAQEVLDQAAEYNK